MPCIDVMTLKAARMGGVPISLTKVLTGLELTTAILTATVPDWLAAEFSLEGLCISKARSGQWILEPLSD